MDDTNTTGETCAGCGKEKNACTCGTPAAAPEGATEAPAAAPEASTEGQAPAA